MNLFFLIIILVASLVTMVCSIITTILVVKKYNGRDILNKAFIVSGIVILISLVIGLAIWVSSLEVSDKTTKKTTTSATTSELTEAGFNEITLDEYLELIKSSEKSIVLVARPTCYYCNQFTPILKQAKEDMNLTINYINTDNFSEEDYETFNNSLDYLKNTDWGTPLTLIVQNGDTVAENSGYVELDTIKKFFTDNGFGN